MISRWKKWQTYISTRSRFSCLIFQIRVSKKVRIILFFFFSFFQKLREIDWNFLGSNIFTKEELKESISRKKILREWISRFSTLAFLPQHIISFSLITWNQLIKNVFYMRCFQLQFVNDLFFSTVLKQHSLVIMANLMEHPMVNPISFQRG